MAYFTGSAVSYSELLTALVAACTSRGWTWGNGILSKGVAFIRPTALDADSGSRMAGLRVEGGTGQSGATLLGASGALSRCGRVGYEAYWATVNWPVSYHIFVNESPDEVYLIINTNITNFYWLGFGVSTVAMPGTGLWTAGSAAAVSRGVFGAGRRRNDNGYVSGCLFTADQSNTVAAEKFTALQRDAGGAWPNYQSTGSIMFDNLMDKMMNQWNGAPVLLPIREFESVAENKRRLLIDVAHARTLLVNNFLPGQQLVLDDDTWRVFPFYRFNAAGSTLYDTGWYGWALRE